MNLPYSKALLWLYIEGKEHQHVLEQLDELTLPTPSTELLDIYKEQAATLPIPPSTFKRVHKKLYDESDHALLNKLGFEEIYLRSIEGTKPPWDQILKLLKNPVARTGVDCGLMCKVPLKDLAQMIPVAFHEAISQEGLALYGKYFCDTQQMTKSDWKEYLKLCANIPYLYVRYHAALTKPVKEALYLAGLPSKTAFADFLKTVLATSEYKFQYYSRHNTPCSDAQARAWSKIGFDAGVRYEKFSASDVTDFSATVQTTFEYEESDIETISSDLLSEVKPPDVDVGKDTDAPVPKDIKKD